MTHEQTKNCLVFLQRVELKGIEAPAFIEVWNALADSLEPAEAPKEGEKEA